MMKHEKIRSLSFGFSALGRLGWDGNGVFTKIAMRESTYAIIAPIYQQETCT